MKETISKRINEFLTLERYLKLIGMSLLMAGLGLFAYCMLFDIPMMIVKTTSNPLFFLIFGMVVLCFRYFMIVTDKKEECE